MLVLRRNNMMKSLFLSVDLFNIIYLLNTWFSFHFQIWMNIVGFGIGLCLYGPISIFGVAAIESAPCHMSGTAHAVACLFASCKYTNNGVIYHTLALL